MSEPASIPPSEAEMARLHHYYDLEIEMVRAVHAFEHALLQPLFLLNGGGAVAYVALMGTLKAQGLLSHCAVAALVLWVAGLVLAVVGAAFAALSQFRFRNLRGLEAVLAERHTGLHDALFEHRPSEQLRAEARKRSQQGRMYRRIAFVLGIASLLAFVVALIPAVTSLGG